MKKTDILFIIQFLIFISILVWLTGIQITPLILLQYLMGTWLYIIYLISYRLRKAVSTIESELSTTMQSKKIEISNHHIRWAHLIKKSKKIPVIFSVILIMTIITALVFEVPLNLFRNIFLLILFINIMMYGVSLFISLQRYFVSIVYSYKEYILNANNKSLYVVGTKQLVKYIIEGLLIGLIFGSIIYYFFDIEIFNLINYCLAFGFLYSLSKLLAVTNRSYLLTMTLIKKMKIEK